MRNSFKTPALYDFLASLAQQYPAEQPCAERKVISSFLPDFSSINLAEDQRLKLEYALLNRETYDLPIHLTGGTSVRLCWDIDLVIDHINTAGMVPQLTAISKIAHDTNYFTDKDFLAKLEYVRMHQDEKFNHKLQPIILAQLPFFPQTSVIDGNHRLCEAICANRTSVETIFIPPDDSYKFLLPNSQNLIYLLAALNDFLQQCRHE